MLKLLDVENVALWVNIFNLFMVALVLYSIMHKVWERSVTTMIALVGFGMFGLLFQFVPFGITVMYLMVFLSLLYYRTMSKPRKYKSKHKGHSFA